MPKRLLAVPFLIIALSLAAQNSVPSDKPAAGAPYVIPPEIANQRNPVKPTLESLAKAKKTYGYDCAMCHGKDGAGDGDMVEQMKLKLLDYRDPAALKEMKDGEMFYIIKNGKNDMPEEGDRVKDEGVWNLVLYIRSMAKKS